MLVDADSGDWRYTTRERAAYELVPADYALFDEALRVTVPKKYPKPWDVVVHSPMIPVALPAGRVLLVAVWMRAEITQGGQSGNAKLFLERTPDWEELGQAGGTLDGHWRQLYIAAVTEKAFPANSVQLAIHLGFDRQTIELGPISIIDLGPADEIDIRDLPTNAITWPGMEADAPWRAEAQRRIEQYRKRDLELTILDVEEAPVADAVVHITQLKRTCSIGSFTGHKLLSDLANRDQKLDKYERLFDRATVPVYWADWGWLSLEDDYVAMAEWAGSQPYLDIRGHTLIYPGWRFMPTHMKELAGDPEAFQEACLEQIRWVAERLKGVEFRELDVTNELRQLTEVVEIVGKEGVVEWFAEARRAFPGVKLCLNENTILNNAGDTQYEQDNLLYWYNFLKENGQAPDVLGFQGHFSENVTGVERMWAIIDRFATETDAEIQITEYDLNTLNDEAQASYTRDFLTAMFSHPAVTGITMWGFWEGDHWIPNAATWLKDWSPRPAATVYEELLGEIWRTDIEAETDAEGQIQGRVFTGELLVTVTAPGGQPASVPITVEPGTGIAVQTIYLPK